MGEIKGFIISLISASAASAIIEGFVPDTGGMKKYLKYIVSLAILLTLLIPLRSLVSAIPKLADELESGDNIFSYENVDAMARVNSLVALHIAEAVCDKFDIAESDIAAELYDDHIIITLKKHFWLFESDIREYVSTKFGLSAEVVFYE